MKARVEVCIERDSHRTPSHGEGAARAVHNLVSRFDYGIKIENEGSDVEEKVNEITNMVLMSNEVLYHGSSNKLIGDKLNPSQGEDSEQRPENNQFGVYATDRKDLAIVMGIFGCKYVIGSSIDEYQEGKLNARIYGDFPKQKYIYVYHLPIENFKQIKLDKHQFVSSVPIKPIKIEKILIKDYIYLIRKATKEETDDWIKKYKK